MAVAWEAVKNALVANLPAVLGTGTFVSDGPVVDGSAPRSYLIVGHLPSRPDSEAGGFSQSVGPDGFSATETGNVDCEAAAVSGDTAMPSVFTVFGLIATYLQANQTLGGVLSPGSTITASCQVAQQETTAGAVQRLIVSVNYFTRI